MPGASRTSNHTLSRKGDKWLLETSRQINFSYAPFPVCQSKITARKKERTGTKKRKGNHQSPFFSLLFVSLYLFFCFFLRFYEINSEQVDEDYVCAQKR
jgi:hypothetical protein